MWVRLQSIEKIYLHYKKEVMVNTNESRKAEALCRPSAFRPPHMTDKPYPSFDSSCILTPCFGFSLANLCFRSLVWISLVAWVLKRDFNGGWHFPRVESMITGWTDSEYTILTSYYISDPLSIRPIATKELISCHACRSVGPYEVT